jgi:hypothetical protein
VSAGEKDRGCFPALASLEIPRVAYTRRNGHGQEMPRPLHSLSDRRAGTRRGAVSGSAEHGDGHARPAAGSAGIARRGDALALSSPPFHASPSDSSGGGACRVSPPPAKGGGFSRLLLTSTYVVATYGPLRRRVESGQPPPTPSVPAGRPGARPGFGTSVLDRAVLRFLIPFPPPGKPKPGPRALSHDPVLERRGAGSTACATFLSSPSARSPSSTPHGSPVPLRGATAVDRPDPACASSRERELDAAPGSAFSGDSAARVPSLNRFVPFLIPPTATGPEWPQIPARLQFAQPRRGPDPLSLPPRWLRSGFGVNFDAAYGYCPVLLDHVPSAHGCSILRLAC